LVANNDEKDEKSEVWFFSRLSMYFICRYQIKYDV
jgi:hypothetical protein